MRALIVTALLVASLAMATQAKYQHATPRIVGGDVVAPHSYPELVSFQLSFFGGAWRHNCGGSILDESTIITAAHCCDGLPTPTVQVVAGDHNLKEDDGTEQARTIVELVQHEEYASFGSYGMDICLLRLEEPLELIDGIVQAVNLPEASDLNAIVEGDAIAAGWGNTQGDGSDEDLVHDVHVPLVSDEGCIDSYGDEVEGDNMICAGIEGKDSCQGDSGGPLFWYDEQGTRLLIGVTSWGNGCGEPGYPGVYAETAAFLDWIEANR